MIWLGIKREAGGEITVNVDTDSKADYTEKVVSRNCATFAHVDFAHISFKTDRRPTMKAAQHQGEEVHVITG